MVLMQKHTIEQIRTICSLWNSEKLAALNVPTSFLFAGAVIAYNAGVNRAIGIFTCWIALFAPGIMLIYGVMPWWGSFRRFQIYRR